MQGGKRHRETTPGEVAPKPKRQALSKSQSNNDFYFTWDESTLPIEIVEFILLDGNRPTTTPSYTTFLLIVVCRRVCKWWHAILPSPSSLKARRSKLDYKNRGFSVAAAREGYSTLLAWATENGCPVGYDAFRQAARTRNVEMFKWLWERYEEEIQFGYTRLRQAIEKGGSIEIAKWLIERGCYNSRQLSVPYYAAAKGNLDYVMVMYEDDYPWDPKNPPIVLPILRMFQYAAKGGHVHVMEYLLEKDKTNRISATCHLHVARLLASKGHLAGLKWIVEKMGSQVLDKRAMEEAAKTGQLEVMKFLKSKSFDLPPNGLVTRHAAALGKTEVIQWAIENGEPIDVDKICKKATKKGHLHVLMWIFENGYGESIANRERVLSNVAVKGGKEFFEWAMKNGCKLDVRLCIRAIKRERWPTLAWLINKGCPINTKVCAKLMRKQNLKGLKVLMMMEKKKRKVEEEDGGRKLLDESVFREAAAKGYFDALEWLREQGCPWDESVTQAAADCSEREAFAWLVQRGCPVDNETLSWSHKHWYDVLELKK